MLGKAQAGATGPKARIRRERSLASCRRHGRRARSGKAAAEPARTGLERRKSTATAQASAPFQVSWLHRYPLAELFQPPP